jgi:hypothetical protein
LAIFFLCPTKQFLPISFQIQLLEYYSKFVIRIFHTAADFKKIFFFGGGRKYVKETAETESEVAEKSSKERETWFGLEKYKEN